MYFNHDKDPFTDYSRAGGFFLALENGYGMAEIPPSVLFLRPNESLDELLKKSEPLVNVRAKGLGIDLTSYGYNEGESVPIFAVCYHKVDGEDVDLVESIRSELVGNRFTQEHSSFLVEEKHYDEGALGRINDANRQTSYGFALLIKDRNNESFACLGTADLKYGATEAYFYEEAREDKIKLNGEKVKEFLSLINAARECGVEGFTSSEIDSENIEQTLEEQDDGSFLLTLKPAKVEKGQLPVHTLLVPASSITPHLELGQFTSSEKLKGGSLFLVALLMDLFSSLQLNNNNLVAGFSVSPMLLNSIVDIKRDSLNGFRTTNRFIQNMGFGENIDAEKFKSLISRFISEIKSFPFNEVKKTRVVMKDGPSFILNGLFQAETFEFAYYLGNPS